MPTDQQRKLKIMNHNNKKKAKQLGMPFGTANGQLRKRLLFHLICKYGENTCYRCQEAIESVDAMSIEHKIAWLDNSPELFWDINNIAFSHLTCNVAAGKKVNGGKLRIQDPVGKAWCNVCKQHLPRDSFSKNIGKGGRFGLHRECQTCRLMR